MPLQIVRNDIAQIKADAIVNTANPHAAVGAGVDSAIYKKAGYQKLLAERAKIGDIRPGRAAITPAFPLIATGAYRCFLLCDDSIIAEDEIKPCYVPGSFLWSSAMKC